MPYKTLSVAIPRSPARNNGEIVGQMRPLAAKQVWSIRVRLEMADNKRDLVLLNTAIDSKLRGCDLVSLKVRDVVAAGHVKDRTSATQSKAGNRFTPGSPTGPLNPWRAGSPILKGLDQNF